MKFKIVSTEQFLNESLEVHDELNLRLFDSNGILYDDVRDRLLEISNYFIEDLNVNNIPIRVIDKWLVGSNASYNYNENSDIDIHLIADISDTSNEPKLLTILYNYVKSDFNNNYNIKVKGLEVELYVEDVNSSAITNGIYSIESNEWVKFPEKIKVPDIDVESITDFKELYSQYKSVKDEDIQNLIDKLYLLRKTSLAQDGEFGWGNLVFKEFRNRGYLDKLKKRQKEIISKELTLEKINW